MSRDSVHSILTAGAASLLMCIAACTAADAPEPQSDEPVELEVIDGIERLHMPQVPPVHNGELATVGTGDVKPEYAIDDTWPAHAVRCDSAGFVQLIARGEGFGTAILFAPPDSGSGATTYPVVDAEEGPIEPGTARIGIQWFPEERPYVFRGKHGTLELTRAQRRLAGYFTTEFYETSFLDSMYMAGSFADVRIDSGTARECDLIPPPDTADAGDS